MLCPAAGVLLLADGLRASLPKTEIGTIELVLCGDLPDGPGD
jgi:hypothetical protein